MTNLEFMDFQSENCGNDKYIKSVKEINEIIHSNSKEERKKNEVYTISDWAKNSDHYIMTHYWDCGKGKFMFLQTLENEVNRTIKEL